MAAPLDVTILDMNGKWVLDKSLSSSPDPLLSLQGIGWVTRKAIGLATITQTIRQYTQADPATSEPVVILKSTQTATGGLASTTEVHSWDWSDIKNEDPLFGCVIIRDRLVHGSESPEGTIRPDIDVQTDVNDERVKKFLTGELLLDGGTSGGFMIEGSKDAALGESQGLWLQEFGRNIGSGWTMEQVWGFEMVRGERRHTRRVVIAKGDKYECGRLVYKFLGRGE